MRFKISVDTAENGFIVRRADRRGQDKWVYSTSVQVIQKIAKILLGEETGVDLYIKEQCKDETSSEG